mmetsp:Transcript_4925/g.20933  ORF Transcript_4925/g.20933 Transcript_4925/m.20933 type:complete len:371 (+) Transcript_4925:714-1826(+)
MLVGVVSAPIGVLGAFEGDRAPRGDSLARRARARARREEHEQKRRSSPFPLGFPFGDARFFPFFSPIRGFRLRVAHVRVPRNLEAPSRGNVCFPSRSLFFAGFVVGTVHQRSPPASAERAVLLQRRPERRALLGSVHERRDGDAERFVERRNRERLFLRDARCHVSHVGELGDAHQADVSARRDGGAGARARRSARAVPRHRRVRFSRRRRERGQSPRRVEFRLVPKSHRRRVVGRGSSSFVAGAATFADGRGDRERGVEDDLGRAPALQPRRAGDQLGTEHGVDEEHFVFFVDDARTLVAFARRPGNTHSRAFRSKLLRSEIVRVRKELAKAASRGRVASRVESQREARDARFFTLAARQLLSPTPGFR